MKYGSFLWFILGLGWNDGAARASGYRSTFIFVWVMMLFGGAAAAFILDFLFRH